MATLSEKVGSQHAPETVVSPSPTLAPSLRQSSEVPKQVQPKGEATIVVDWKPADPDNPMNWSIGYRRFVSAVVSAGCNQIPVPLVTCSLLCQTSDWLVVFLCRFFIQRLCRSHSRHHARNGTQPRCGVAGTLLVRARIWAGPTHMGTSIRGTH